MEGFLGAAYLWIKALHVISVIAWMAGMLYLPRLFVYHCAAEPGSIQSETFKVMERRLLRAIVNPAMIASWLFGLMLVAHLGAWNQGWMQASAGGPSGIFWSIMQSSTRRMPSSSTAPVSVNGVGATGQIPE